MANRGPEVQSCSPLRSFRQINGYIAIHACRSLRNATPLSLCSPKFIDVNLNRLSGEAF